MDPVLDPTIDPLHDGPVWLDDDGPPLPLGHRVELADRGTIFYREVEGPRNAPTVVLVHGWIASGGLNWFRVFEILGRHFRVIAPDMRGHGRGIRTHRAFKLEDCADDVAALMDELDCGPAIVVGYSMGGPIASLLWKRHPEKVAALGLCATGQEFVAGNRERYALLSLTTALTSTTRVGNVVGWLPNRMARAVIGPLTPAGRPNGLSNWAQAEMRRHSMRAIAEAGTAIARFNSQSWTPDIDVPTTVLITQRDSAVSPEAQRRLARSIPGAKTQRFNDGHLACVNPRFSLAVSKLCLGLADRAGLTKS
jgi:pimeloyl-ACP methyl ester carboxylesterase